MTESQFVLIAFTGNGKDDVLVTQQRARLAADADSPNRNKHQQGGDRLS